MTSIYGDLLTMKKVTELLGDLYGLVSASMGPNGKAVMINIHSPKQIVVTKVIGIIMGARPHEKAAVEAAFSRPPPPLLSICAQWRRSQGSRKAMTPITLRNFHIKCYKTQKFVVSGVFCSPAPLAFSWVRRPPPCLCILH